MTIHCLHSEPKVGLKLSYILPNFLGNWNFNKHASLHWFITYASGFYTKNNFIHNF